MYLSHVFEFISLLSVQIPSRTGRIRIRLSMPNPYVEAFCKKVLEVQNLSFCKSSFFEAYLSQPVRDGSGRNSACLIPTLWWSMRRNEKFKKFHYIRENLNNFKKNSSFILSAQNHALDRSGPNLTSVNCAPGCWKFEKFGRSQIFSFWSNLHEHSLRSHKMWTFFFSSWQ